MYDANALHCVLDKWVCPFIQNKGRLEIYFKGADQAFDLSVSILACIDDKIVRRIKKEKNIVLKLCQRPQFLYFSYKLGNVVICQIYSDSEIIMKTKQKLSVNTAKRPLVFQYYYKRANHSTRLIQ